MSCRRLPLRVSKNHVPASGDHLSPEIITFHRNNSRHRRCRMAGMHR
ncbi:hypothetical protein [Ignatzschineria indica]|nr:hypothetical protein [Ignatzschineria indica]